MTFTQAAFASAITALTAWVTMPLWRRVTDRVGHTRVLMPGPSWWGCCCPAAGS